MKRLFVSLIPFALLLAACSDSAPTTQGSGQARIQMTDAPVSEATSLPVTFSTIELVGEAAGRATVAVEPQTVDVLSLRNGGVETLGEVELPAGNYNQIRLIVDDAQIVFGDEESFPVKVPSGAQTGLKINIDPPLEIEEGDTAELLLDFDAQRAIVETPPGSGNYLLKPTAIRAVTAAGGVEGTVVTVPTVGDEPLVPLPSVTVTVLDQQGTVITSTITEADGSFRIISLEDGIYDIEFSLEGYALVTLQDVVVVEGETEVLGEITLGADGG